jgi:hypothetical protein
MSWFIVSKDDFHPLTGPFESSKAASEMWVKCERRDQYTIASREAIFERIEADFVKAAKDAITVQNACNLTGVAQSYAKATTCVRRYVEWTAGSDWNKFNTHPVLKLWLYKLMDLQGEWTCGTSDYANAMNACTAIVNEHEHRDKEKQDKVLAASQGFGMGTAFDA